MTEQMENMSDEFTMPERRRRRVVHGWAFRDLPESEVQAIRAYLASGKRRDLPEPYRRIFDLAREER